jgi:hypothetical protein
MDHEFHYYITYLIAARAGFAPPEAQTLAWASQYTDDNTAVFTIDRGLPTEYANYISQTMNILKPQRALFRIYPLFHFIPGDPMSPSAWRKDGAMHWLNTTPDSENANLILDAALATGNPHRIGIACHGYADTWAHQNFVGYLHEFNAMTGPIDAAIPDIGHADAQHAPDQPARVWQDDRLLNGRVDNRARFLDAAAGLYRRLSRHIAPRMRKKERLAREAALRADLDRCIGPDDPGNDREEERIARYRELAAVGRAYGSREMDPYDANRWMDEAVETDVRGVRDRGDSVLARLDPLKDRYRWRDPARRRETPWHRFQEAVKAHQNESWAILEHRNFLGLDLPAL